MNRVTVADRHCHSRLAVSAGLRGEAQGARRIGARVVNHQVSHQFRIVGVGGDCHRVRATQQSRCDAR